MSIMQHIVTFSYILSFFSGVVCLAFLVAAKQQLVRKFSLDYKMLRRFLVSFFIFFADNFMIFYNEFFVLSPEITVILLIIFDITMVMAVGTCIKLNSVTSKMIFRVYSITGAVYVIMWTLAYMPVFSGSPVVRPMLELIADAVFCAVSVGMMVVCIGNQFRYNEDPWKKRYLVTVDIVLGVYICMLYCTDLYFNFSQIYISENISYPYLIDPVFCAFSIINVYTIVYFVYHFRILNYYEVSEEPQPSESEEMPGEAFDIHVDISSREREVAELVLKGMSNPEIAEELCISVYTVKRHMSSILKKYGVKNRIELISIINDEENNERY